MHNYFIINYNYIVDKITETYVADVLLEVKQEQSLI